MGILTANIADCVDDEGRAGGCGAGTKMAFVGVSTGIYAGIGTAIDAIFTGRTRLYEAPVGPDSAHWERVAGPQPARQVLLNFSFSW